VPFEAMEPLDQYMLAKMADLNEKILKAYEEFEFHRVYHALNEFCNSELSAFYLDVLKDRMYTLAPSDPSRLSAQTAIWKITNALVRLVAPILSFTADEVWQYLPKLKDASTSVHLTLFPKPEELVPQDTTQLMKDWELLLTVRNKVLMNLETLRAEKVIGKALEAIVTLKVREDSESDHRLQHYAVALPELFNVSEVEFLKVEHNDPDYLPELRVRRSEQPKCDRCWRYTADVGSDARWATVCARCAKALDAVGFAAINS